jgi:hypothetical protein
MTSQSAPSSPPIEALNAYDDSSSMKITAVKSTRVIALGDRLFHLPMTEASIFIPSTAQPPNQVQSNKLPNKSIKYAKILFQSNKYEILDLK